MEGEGWGSAILPAEAESFFTHGSFFYGARTYTTRQQQVWLEILPHVPIPDEAVEVGFQGPVGITTTGAVYESHGPWRRRQQQQQGKRGRVSEAAVLRLLHEVEAPGTDDDCCAICLEDLAAAGPAALTLRAMPGCSHTFHQHCILQWLRLKASCPVCRRQLPLSLSTEEEGEDEEEQSRRSRRRRRSVYDDWLALSERSSRRLALVTREE